MQSLSTAHDSTDPAVELTDALLTASRALVAVAARSLAAVDGDVTLPQYRALVVLAARGPQLVGQLADQLAVHPSTATRLCDRLVAKSLVARSIAETNRRETTITLAPTGRRIVDTVTALRRDEIERIVSRIPEHLRRPAVRALAAFSDAAGELPDRSWTLGWS
jgi:DNA-binding MarR family transcriptional regulator